MAMRYIVVTGGVVSGLGKGITISSLGRILKSSGLRTTSIKIDPYMNFDSGTMSPFEHGETFVLDDGGETDLDLGNYERFLDVTLSKDHNITTGKVYTEVISRERRGDYLGKTVQIVPHATDLIMEWLQRVSKVPVDGSGQEPDVCLIEVGGTVGDIESMVFLEALRQFQFKVGIENCMFFHVSLVPIASGEQKTKPTQHSVKELRSLGISPDVVVCRSKEMLSMATREKMSLHCQVGPGHVLSVHDVPNIYHVPIMLAEQNVHSIIKTRLHLDRMTPRPCLTVWKAMAQSVDTTTRTVDIAIVGKYSGQQDSYLSIIKSLLHSGIHLNLKVEIHWIEAEDLEDTMIEDDNSRYEAAWDLMKKCAGVIVPGGFGARGVEGKCKAARYARENKVPYLGVCLGMQVMVIEYARNVLGLTDATSAEFDKEQGSKNHVIMFMPEIDEKVMGGTMRLGSRPTTVTRGTSSSRATCSLAYDVYGLNREEEEATVSERHRHRYEVNPDYVSRIEAQGLRFTGKDEKKERMEIAELDRGEHPFYFGTQFHPEFKSRPNRPSPPFYAFVATAADSREELRKAGEMWQEHVRSNGEGSQNAIPTSPLGKRVRTLSRMESEETESRSAGEEKTEAEGSSSSKKKK